MDMRCGDEVPDPGFFSTGSVNQATREKKKKKIGRYSLRYVFTIGHDGPFVGHGEPVSVSRNDEKVTVRTKQSFKNVTWKMLDYK